MAHAITPSVDKQCPYCLEGLLDPVHESTVRHHLNSLLYKFSDSSKDYRRLRHGVKITETCSLVSKAKKVSGKRRKRIMAKIDVGEPVHFELVVKNERTSPITLLEVCRLAPYPSFELTDKFHFADVDSAYGPPAIEIKEGINYVFCAKFLDINVGQYSMPIHFRFRYGHNKGQKDFSIVREIEVVTQEPDVSLPVEKSEDKEKSPYQKDRWGPMESLIHGTKKNGTLLTKMTECAIPADLKPLLLHDLKLFPEMTTEQRTKLENMVARYVEDDGKTKRPVTKTNYKQYWSDLLHIEEQEVKNKMALYNMTSVWLQFSDFSDKVELVVPGLAEKRPSLLKGDVVYIRVCCEPKTQYSGEIVEVMDDRIAIGGLIPYLLDKLRRFPQPVDVRFAPNRFPLVVQHKAVARLSEEFKNVLFMEKEPAPWPQLVDNATLNSLTFFNQDVNNNQQQRQAVLNILKASNLPAPYIVFGPPGTGKTVTLVEAILQVKEILPRSRILVCAQSNSACDNIAEKLIHSGQCTQREIIRLISPTANMDVVPKDVRPILRETSSMPEGRELRGYRIVVATLTSSGRLYDRTTFTHVFMDEAGQASEPEAVAGFSGLLLPAMRGRAQGVLVMAGDPKQLGPVCNGTKSERFGLGFSLLDRLMSTLNIYAYQVGLGYKERFITKLVENFRSDGGILELSNKLFYKGELVPKAMKDSLTKLSVVKGMSGGPVLFHGVIGKEGKEGKSPSIFNNHEITIVVQYVGKFLNNKNLVKPEDIGVIAPYARQVYKLKQAMRMKQWHGVEVGTTEVFQGREKRVIIVSCVRSQSNMIAYDKKFKLGFLRDPRRFNVMMTRAQAKLIIVGNPTVLAFDPIWLELIKYCSNNKQYTGCPLQIRDDLWVDEMSGKMRKLNLEDQENQDA